MICISVIFFRNVVNKFNNILSIFKPKLLFFLNIVTYFVSTYCQNKYGYFATNFFYSFNIKANRCRHLFSIGGQLLTFIRKFYEEKKKQILVVG